MIEKTLILIKPDGVERGLVGKVIERFENVGLKIIGMKMVWVDAEFSKKHYKALIEKPFYKGLEDFIISGPVVALALEGVSAIKLVRKMVGETEPMTALPGTIRGDFSHHTYKYTDDKGIAIKNIIHASGDKEDAKAEIGLWFNEKELHSYEVLHEKHTR